MLFLRELKKIVCSISYVLFVIVVTFALYSQDVLDFSDSKITEPQPDGNYGVTQKEIPEIIMPAALEKLWTEFCENNYRTYPIGLIKNVKLSDNEQSKIAEIISEITGVGKDEILNMRQDFVSRTGITDVNNNSFVIGADGNMQMDGDGYIIYPPAGSVDNAGTSNNPDSSGDSRQAEAQMQLLSVRNNMEYSEFKSLMQQIDDILGGGSDYAAESLTGFGAVPVTYEEAVQKYDVFINKDKITGGYARLFSDYAVAMEMSVLPVFLAVLMCMKDSRAKMTEIIYTRRTSALEIITVRYFSIITAVMIPVIILSYVSNASVWGQYAGAELDYLAPLKYDLGWVMPSAMIGAAMGMCLTELTNTPIAVAVQGFWWLYDINVGIRSVSSSYSLFRLAPRHNAGENSYFRTQDYLDNFSRLTANRLLFAGISILLIAVTIVIYEAKRKGLLKGKIYGKFNFKKGVSKCCKALLQH